MKRKDLIQAIMAAVIFVAIGAIVVTQLMPQKASGNAASSAEVEVAHSFNAEIDRSTLGNLSDTSKTRDFGITFDLTTGLGNQTPFGR